ncbi:hypothetical protein [Nocardia sp. NPDC052566]|uniref:DUF7373 family lipoprotein n=1 Tax=Nocardia sp. NPDC052566 TaxID=3364330 RepID=UPI0037CB0702
MLLRSVIALAVVATVLAFTSGCARQGNPLPATVDLASLDLGPYSIEPLAEPRNSSEKYGRILESARMAEVMVDPAEADPALTRWLGGSPVPTPSKTAGMLAEPVQAVLARHGMIAGFRVGGRDYDGPGYPPVGTIRLLTALLLRFPDADSARQAAQEIDSVDAAVSSANVPVEIPGYPAARGHWRPTVPTLAATLAHESFVITVLIGHTSPDLGVLTGVAAKAFGAQMTRLRDFRPTPRDQLAALPLDQEGMLRRVLPARPGVWPYPVVYALTIAKNAGWDYTTFTNGFVYGPRALYLLGGRAEGSRSLDQSRELAGELSVGSGTGNLRRFATPAIARKKFALDVAAPTAEEGKRVVEAPKKVPEAWCTESLTLAAGSPRFGCLLLYGRYMALVRGISLKDTHQQAAAQYGLLVNAETR